MNIDIWPRKLGEVPLKTQHGGRFGPNLHEAYLSNGADCARIVAALDRRDCIGNVRRQTVLFGFPPDQRLVDFFGFVL
jgi:hypothetical protein